MPGLYGGFGNYFIPIFLGAPEVAFPRINSFSFILLLLSYELMIMAMISEFPGGGGWTLYPPLSTSLMSLSPVTIDLIIDGLLINGISSFFSSLNFMGTISNIRLSGFILLSLFSCGIFITVLLLLLTLPILTGALGMLLGDLHFNTIYFDSGFGGDPVLYQHFFWFFGHPEVYILIIPAFGIISQVLSNISEKIIFGIQSMILAMSCISILGSIVWGHHIYTLGLEVDTRGYFMIITIMISLQTGTKIFNWLSTILGCYYIIIIFNYMIFIIIFIIMFTLGGSTGVVLGNAAVDVSLHDTYYVIAHFHYILSLGAIIAFFLGLLYYQDIIFCSYSLMPPSSSRNARFHGLLSFFWYPSHVHTHAFLRI
jgi:cytochrome c oxidase subunit 1